MRKRDRQHDSTEESANGHEQRWAAAQRSYTTPAILTLVLYFVLWLPGLVANIAYIEQARHDEELLGYDPEGVTCLYSLLGVFAVIPAVIVMLLIAFGLLIPRIMHH